MARVRPQTSSLIPGLFRQRAADVQTPADVRFVTHVVDNIEINVVDNVLQFQIEFDLRTVKYTYSFGVCKDKEIFTRCNLI